MRIFIDLETKSEADLPGVGAWRYSEHPTTEILCAAYCIEGSDDVKLWIPGQPVPPEFTAADEYIARNAKFEYAMIANCGIKKYGFPEIMREPWRWYDTQALCRNAGYSGSLDKSAKALGLKNQKDPAGETLIKKISIPTRGKNGIKWKDVSADDLNMMYEYCKQDVRTDAECWERLKELPTFKVERDTWLIDFLVNIRGIRIDVDSLDAVLKAYNDLSSKAEAECEALGVNVRSTKAFPEWLRLHGVNVKSINKDEIGKIESRNPKVQRAVQLREFLGLASAKKLQVLKDMTSPDGFCRYLLDYYGAGTGRWSSRGVQIHNLSKASWKDNEKPLEVIESEIAKIKSGQYKIETFGEIAKRIIPGLLIPREGKRFVMGDFASIEGRVAAYLSGCEKMLAVYRRDGDLYREMAASLYRVVPDAVTKKQRAVGKALILGCQYGLGHQKFIEYCKGIKIVIDPVEAGSAVSAYRKTYAEIPKVWRTYEQAFDLAWTKKRTVAVGLIEFTGFKSYVRVLLPSGRALYYHQPEISDGKISIMNFSRECRVDIWGGVLTENICQAVARDILAERIEQLVKNNIYVPFSVHDEIICEVPENDQKADVILSLLNHPPAWLPGFPLKTEIETNATKYHK